MRTIVITGGTDGMGAALARHYLTAGDRVTVIGRSRSKFDTLVATVAGKDSSAESRAEFLAADLSLVADSRRVVEQLVTSRERIDVLILAASFIRQHREVTSEGHEASWSLFFLSKHLLVTGLAPSLRSAERPIIVNTAVPGAQADAIDFDDLESAQGFSFASSNAQQRRANELLGIRATADNPQLAYVTWGPARLVRTSFAGEIGRGMRVAATVLGTVLGQRPEVAVRPVIQLIDDPKPGRAAYRGGTRRALTLDADEERDSARLVAAVDISL